MMNKATSNTESSVRILRAVTCPSLSGKSKLTYEVGWAGKDDVGFRIVANSSSGCFSREWVTLKTLLNAFDEIPTGQTITSDVLMPLFRGVSANTPFFIFAALKNEGLVKLSVASKRRYDRVDPKPFLAAIQAPGEAKGDTASKSKKPKEKATPKKKSARR